MLFAYLFSLSHAVLQQCIAPLKISKIPSDYDIIQYLIIINYGTHSPKKTFLGREERGFWYCDSNSAHSSRTNVFPLGMPRSIHSIVDKRYSEYPPNCFLNDLTVEGMNQIYNLGLNYRKYLLSVDPDFFKGEISNKFYIRATNDDISFKNAVSFLTGLFNNEKIGDLEIITGTKNKEIIIPNEKFCKDIQKSISDYESSDECKELISKAQNDLHDILKYLKYDQSLTRSQLINICEFIISMHCNEQTSNLNLTDEIFEKVQTYYSKLSFNSFFLASKSKRGIAASTIMREILRTTNKTIENKSTIKFSLFSSDDSAIAAVLSLLRQKRVIVPDASHLSIAILKKNNSNYIQISLNGKPLIFPINDETIIKYTDFRDYVNNYVDFCIELP